VRGSTGTEQPCVALEIPVELGWVCNNLVNDRARKTVTTLVGLSWPGEETDVMAFRYHNNCDFRVDSKPFASSCEEQSGQIQA
jgi:hypothetical protein